VAAAAFEFAGRAVDVSGKVIVARSMSLAASSPAEGSKQALQHAA
jgi:hypothetical protein